MWLKTQAPSVLTFMSATDFNIPTLPDHQVITLLACTERLLPKHPGPMGE